MVIADSSQGWGRRAAPASGSPVAVSSGQRPTAGVRDPLYRESGYHRPYRRALLVAGTSTPAGPEAVREEVSARRSGDRGDRVGGERAGGAWPPPRRRRSRWAG